MDDEMDEMRPRPQVTKGGNVPVTTKVKVCVLYEQHVSGEIETDKLVEECHKLLSPYGHNIKSLKNVRQRAPRYWDYLIERVRDKDAVVIQLVREAGLMKKHEQQEADHIEHERVRNLSTDDAIEEMVSQIQE